TVGKGELLVKAMACGICGSDVMEWYRIKKAPRVLGHEMAGVVAESEDNPFKVGDRVFVSHHVPCGSCHYCLNGHHTACETLHKTNFDPGGFAEFIRVPEINVKSGVYLLPTNVSFEQATFIEPLACVLRAQKLANIKKGDTILVLGSGISGILHVQLAKFYGAKIFATDINEYRMKMAKKFGADYVLNAKENIPAKLISRRNNLVFRSSRTRNRPQYSHKRFLEK
ncbi:MAG: alcohol dehydrogenase catalytic domain-containing protein, partial [Candidatus Aenigmarchaeota archaeon]|nr:alcohol dehydrogenase catalytic domain-containing protein [Candidatus Aenigmarchaeota archaeon]